MFRDESHCFGYSGGPGITGLHKERIKAHISIRISQSGSKAHNMTGDTRNTLL